MKTYIDQEKNPLKGILLCLSGYFFISLIGIFEKCISSSVSLPVILFFQNIICLSCLLPDIYSNGIRKIKPELLNSYIIRISTGIGCYLTLFYIIRLMPVSQAFLYQYSASLWIPFIAFFWLRVNIAKNLWYGILIGFIGIILILKPSSTFVGLISLIGILCGIFQGISMVAIRKLSLTERVSDILFYYFLIGTLVTSLMLLRNWTPITLKDFYGLAGVGLCTFIGQKLITFSLKYANAATLAPISYTSLLFSGALSWFLWRELPDRLSFFGMSLVIFGCLLTVIMSKSTEKIEDGLLLED